MPFQKGNQLAGSRKGVPNKTTAEIRNAFQMLVEDNLDTSEDEQLLKAIDVLNNL